LAVGFEGPIEPMLFQSKMNEYKESSYITLFQSDQALMDHRIALQPVLEAYRGQGIDGVITYFSPSVQVVTSVDGVAKIGTHPFLVTLAAIDKGKARVRHRSDR
jgi:hypothetical protein